MGSFLVLVGDTLRRFAGGGAIDPASTTAVAVVAAVAEDARVRERVTRATVGSAFDDIVGELADETGQCWCSNC